MVILRFKIHSRPEKSDELMAALAEIITPARAIDGVINFDIARVLRDPNWFIATAVYEDGAALEVGSEPPDDHREERQRAEKEPETRAEAPPEEQHREEDGHDDDEERVRRRGEEEDAHGARHGPQARRVGVGERAEEHERAPGRLHADQHFATFEFSSFQTAAAK